MSTEAIARELTPRSIAELTSSLQGGFPKSLSGGIRIQPMGSACLRVATPIKDLARYRFAASSSECSWTTSKMKLSVRLAHLSIEQKTEDGFFCVDFQQTPIGSALVSELSRSATSKVREIFLVRAFRALEDLNQLEEGTLLEATKASTDYSVLVSALSTEEALAPVRAHDPLAGARLRGLEAKRGLLELEGGAVSSAEAAALLKISRQAVDKRRSEGKLLAVELGRKGYHYPLWQFDLPGRDRVLAALGDLDPWQKLSFFVNPSGLLSDSSPLDALRTGSHSMEEVERAASGYGEHGA